MYLFAETKLQLFRHKNKKKNNHFFPNITITLIYGMIINKLYLHSFIKRHEKKKVKNKFYRKVQTQNRLKVH